MTKAELAARVKFPDVHVQGGRRPRCACGRGNRRDRGFRDLLNEIGAAAQAPQSAHQREHRYRRLHQALIRGQQDPSRLRELATRVIVNPATCDIAR